MSITTDLARHARLALQRAHGATLEIEGIGATGGVSPPLLFEVAGQPRFVCEPGSVLARTAENTAIAQLSLPCCPRERCARQITFAGHLRVVGHEHVDGQPVPVVELTLDSVRVEQPRKPDTGIPLALYRSVELDEDSASARTSPPGSAAADDLVQFADRITAHTNAEHGPELRATAARIAGCHPSDLMAATITALDAHGVELTWIDSCGARTVRLAFATTGSRPAEVAALLRATLAGATNGVPEENQRGTGAP